MSATIDRAHAKALRIACTGCGRCCATMAVPVTDSDVRRLAAYSGRPAGDIIRLCTRDDIDWDADREGWITIGSRRYILTLRKKSDRCLFLSPASRCTVYEARPATCRTFPHDIRLDDDGKPVEVGINKAINCGHRKNGGRHDLTQLAREVAREDEEDRAYHRKLDEWNKRGASGTRHEFLAFMGLA